MFCNAVTEQIFTQSALNYIFQITNEEYTVVFVGTPTTYTYVCVHAHNLILCGSQERRTLQNPFETLANIKGTLIRQHIGVKSAF